MTDIVPYGIRRTLTDNGDRLRLFKIKCLEKRRWMSDLCNLHKIITSSLDCELVEKLNFMIPSRSVRIPQLFTIPNLSVLLLAIMYLRTVKSQKCGLVTT